MLEVLDCIEAQGDGWNHDGWCLGEIIAVDLDLVDDVKGEYLNR